MKNEKKFDKGNIKRIKQDIIFIKIKALSVFKLDLIKLLYITSEKFKYIERIEKE